mmetsp:Transcript_13953/g.44310  ORF Transcript_13953/g.44310 Transcript_13953/m.44310 type:complete len:217 (-) Transcript_13953:80-730(-)
MARSARSSPCHALITGRLKCPSEMPVAACAPPTPALPGLPAPDCAPSAALSDVPSAAAGSSHFFVMDPTDPRTLLPTRHVLSGVVLKSRTNSACRASPAGAGRPCSPAAAPPAREPRALMPEPGPSQQCSPGGPVLPSPPSSSLRDPQTAPHEGRRTSLASKSPPWRNAGLRPTAPRGPCKHPGVPLTAAHAAASASRPARRYISQSPTTPIRLRS